MLNSLIGIIASSGGVAGGDYESIATVTLGSAASSVSFTSISSDYVHLQVRVSGNATGTASGFPDLIVSFNSDTNYLNYSQHTLGGDGSSAYASASIGAPTFTGGYVGDLRDSTTAVSPTAKVIDILDYKNTNKNKTVRTLSGWDANGSGQVRFVSACWMSTAAITSMSFSIRSGTNNINTGSTFALYGIRG